MDIQLPFYGSSGNQVAEPEDDCKGQDYGWKWRPILNAQLNLHTMKI